MKNYTRLNNAGLPWLRLPSVIQLYSTWMLMLICYQSGAQVGEAVTR
jgi:hypothetical protein